MPPQRPKLAASILRLLTPRRIVGLAVFLPILLLTNIVYFGAFDSSSFQSSWASQSPSSPTTIDTCTPAQYAAGKWVYHPRTNETDTEMRGLADALRFSGFEGCASSREVLWHLAADREEQYGRFPRAQGWVWVPGEGCENWRESTREDLVKQLVEQGGWYLVGDSVTENHFFSLSCMLFPHVFATPNYEEGGSFDRAWPQNLYLSPTSPLVDTLSFPEGFNITATPLATFRRNDLLMSNESLLQIYQGDQATEDNIFSDEAVWTIPLIEQLAEFVIPERRYSTMVVSTGGHWTTSLFAPIASSMEEEGSGYGGIERVIALFEEGMRVWARGVQEVLRDYNRDVSASKARVKKRAVVRAYLPGHEDCHKFTEPWEEVQPFVWGWYNWAQIWRFNEIFETLLADKKKYPDVHYLGIDRPARLRPDAHTTGDCLHIMTGAGVLEGWTRYISHFVKSH